MYLKGYGVKRNVKEAVNLFEISAELGHYEAANQLAEIYELGFGEVQKDINKAEFWINKIDTIKDKDEKEMLAGLGYLNLNLVKKSRINNLKALRQTTKKSKKKIIISTLC